MNYHPLTSAAYEVILKDAKLCASKEWMADEESREGYGKRKMKRLAVVSATIEELESRAKKPASESRESIRRAIKRRVKKDYGFDPMTIFAIISIIIKVIEWWSNRKDK
jgi:hypothetical protein